MGKKKKRRKAGKPKTAPATKGATPEAPPPAVIKPPAIITAAEEFERALMALEPRQQRFVREYLLDLNISAAYRRAGYAPANADINGWLLIVKNSAVRNAADLGRRMIAARLDMSAGEITRRFENWSTSDIRNYMRWGPDGVEMFSSDEIDPEHASAIAEIQETVIPQESGAPIRRLKFKLRDAKSALDSLAKVRGLFKDAGGGVPPEMFDKMLDVFVEVIRQFVPRDKADAAITYLERQADGSFSLQKRVAQGG